MQTPFVIINLKCYEKSIVSALNFAHISKKISNESGANICIAPPLIELKDVSKIIPTFSQYVDCFSEGAYTGSVIAKHVKDVGAIGSIINHSERQINFKEIDNCIQRCNENNLLSVVCTKNLEETEEIAELNPDFIAIELPELIGKKSITKVNPQIVKDSVSIVNKFSKKTKVICGAGIGDKKDVSEAISLGTHGVIVSNAIVNSDNVENKIREIVSGL
ncbi:triose-phosphate isomerase [Candidatus Aenigmatarchaeota archaeon]